MSALIPTAALQVCVLPRLLGRSWPKHPLDRCEPAITCTLLEALTRRFETEAYLVAYEPTQQNVRLGKRAIESCAPRMQLLLADVDHHKVRDPDGTERNTTPEEVDAWFESERSKVEALRADHPGVIAYRSRRGYRIAAVLEDRFDITDDDAAKAWARLTLAWRAYLGRRYGIAVDPLKDWARLQRVPHDTREKGDEPDELEVVGDPAVIGFWAPELTEEDWTAADRENEPKTPPRPANVELQTRAPGGMSLFRALLQARGLLGAHDGEKWHVICPRESEHSSPDTRNAGDDTVLYENQGQWGGIYCLHSNCGHDRLRDARDWMDCFSGAEIEAAKRACGIEVRQARVATAPVAASGSPDPEAEQDEPVHVRRTRTGVGRPVVLVRSADPADPHREWHALVEDAATALGKSSDDVYSRDGSLVDAGPLDVYQGGDGKRRKASGVGIRVLPVSEVQRQLSRCATWLERKYDKKSGKSWDKQIDPSQSLAQAVANATTAWKHIRPLVGVLDTPTIRPDGTTVQVAGWDEPTRYLLAPTIAFPAVPEAPTLDDARAALGELRKVFAPATPEHDGFPFAGEADGYVPIAALLTLLARPAIEGPTPAFVFDASTPGSGKTLIADVVSLIAAGVEMPKAPFPEQSEELDKLLGALALQGATIVGFDNVDTRVPFRGAPLDRVLTSTTPQLRILGRTEAPTVTWRAVVMATGNNVRVQGDTVRRCIRCRQEPNCERPEERGNFAIKDLKAYVRTRRGELVVAALTLLKAYFVAGRPAVDTSKAFGSFDAWQRVVVDALAWVAGVNVLDCRTNQDDGDDPEAEAGAQLYDAMRELGRPVSAGELLKAGFDWETGFNGVPRPNSEECPALKEAFMGLGCRVNDRTGRPSPQAVGKALVRLRGRVIDGHKLISRPVAAKGAKSIEWLVEPVGESPRPMGSVSRLSERV